MALWRSIIALMLASPAYGVQFEVASIRPKKDHLGTTRSGRAMAPSAHSETAEPFILALGVLPIFAVFSVLNVTWGAFILARPQWRGGRLWLLAALIWSVAVGIDFAHH
jgi:hypothetical protein